MARAELIDLAAKFIVMPVVPETAVPVSSEGFRSLYDTWCVNRLDNLTNCEGRMQGSSSFRLGDWNAWYPLLRNLFVLPLDSLAVTDIAASEGVRSPRIDMRRRI
ncbi:MAG: hypothetical protein OEQ16_09835 [Gammaproteobacteria bacterium]|jgi:hypothetical protein|nr:hypothetical protein [Gammaproteobacteria bacterium]